MLKLQFTLVKLLTCILEFFDSILRLWWQFHLLDTNRLLQCSINKIKSIRTIYWGGCSPVDWLSQTRRNVSIEFLNLNSKISKIKTVAFILWRKGFSFYCVWVYSRFTSVARRNLSNTYILQNSFLELKSSTRCVSGDILN